MMNGAAMNCQQDQVLRSLHRDSRGLQGAGYHLQMNNPCEQNFPAQHSKAKSSQSDHFVIDDSSQYFQNIPTIDSSVPTRSDVRDPRSQIRWAQARKPIDLPVPHFKIDVNFVGNHLMGPDDSYTNQNSLDLDTRIDLLIKSKALAGMHPIFSELDESTDDSDDSFLKGTKFKGVSRKRHRPPSPDNQFPIDNSDDPDKPLSRPPSPFLSRAKYLFWFNKAIELKEQAKAQEQALIEQATKKLLHDNVASLNSNCLNSVNPNHIEKSNKENKPIVNSLLCEISKEMKEMIKQQCINEVLESTISETLESWWEKEQVKDEQQHLLTGSQKLNSTYQEQSMDISQLQNTEKVIPELVNTASLKDSFSFNHDDVPLEKPLHLNVDSCNKTTYRNLHTKTPVSESPETYTQTEKNPFIYSHTSTPITDGSPYGSEHRHKANLDQKWGDKKSETKTEVNIKVSKQSPIIDIHELLSNIKNSLDNLSKVGISSTMSESKQHLKSDDSTTHVNCQKEQYTSESIELKKSTEFNNSSDVIENQSSTISEHLNNNIHVLNDGDMRSEADSPTIIDNEQIQQSAIETSVLSKHDEKSQILVRTSASSEEVERKSEDIGQNTINVKTEINIKVNKQSPTIDIHELVSNIENPLDDLSKGEVSTKISECKEHLKSDDNTNPESNCQKEHFNSESIKENTECKNSSDVIEDQSSSTISEHLNNNIYVQNDADKRSEADSPTIIDNEQSQQSAIETSVLSKHDEKSQILVRTSSSSEEVESKSEDIGQNTANISVTEEIERICETNLITQAENDEQGSTV